MTFTPSRMEDAWARDPKGADHSVAAVWVVSFKAMVHDKKTVISLSMHNLLPQV